MQTLGLDFQFSEMITCIIYKSACLHQKYEFIT